jgi:hypothetical protein
MILEGEFMSSQTSMIGSTNSGGRWVRQQCHILSVASCLDEDRIQHSSFTLILI